MKWEEIIKDYNPVKQRERRIWVNVPVGKVYNILKQLKDAGFDHLSSISVTDWLDEGKFEITYHLWSYRYKILVTVKTKIDRENPRIKSVYPIYDRNAWIHEREMHELFGVDFIGNPDLSPLFLEDWKEKPPFRKDFDWREYVRSKYYNKENEREKAYWEVWLK
jgi:NADH-quinone oxidoreductase subunit C